MITKEQFDKLYSNDITKKEYDEIISLIDTRFCKIMEIIHPNRDKRMWFDYENCNYDDEKSEGFFDIKKYKDNIYIGGECINFPEPYANYGWLGAGFPTRWLWTDDDEILNEFQIQIKKWEIEELEKKKLAKQKLEELKQKKEKIKKTIESKLTKEELEHVLFK